MKADSHNPRPAKIALLAGDGIGPEVMAEAVGVLQAAAERFGRRLELSEGLIGGIAIQQTGDPLPLATREICQSADAVLLGAVGGPQWDDPSAPVRPEQGLLGLRKLLGVFANLRPVRVHPALVDCGPIRPEIAADVDLIVVRELTGGLYFGERGRRTHVSGEQAFDTMIYSTGEIERLVRLAARLARARRRQLTSVDKANVLETSRLWRATVDRILPAEFPEVRYEHMLVDSAAMHLIRNPRRFDVLVTENMFGDILTDEASVLAGSIGLLPSASLGDGGPGLYEPIHGSAPDIAGKGIANPLGMILSAAMMCRESLSWPDVAEAIESAVDRVILAGILPADLARPGQTPASTTEIGRAVTASMGVTTYK